MLAAAAVVPTPPLLVPEVAGGAAARDADLRDACDAAVATLRGCDRLVVVGSAPATGPCDGGWDWRGFGVAAPPAAPRVRLPLALAVGAWLLDRAGLRGAAHGVAATASPQECAALGAALTAEGDVGLLVCGDGSARRDERAPGHLDPRAAGFDAAAGAALAAGDPDALLALDPGLAAALLAAGRAPWQVLAGAAAGRRWQAQVAYEAAPYGVGYVVATWRPASLGSGS